ANTWSAISLIRILLRDPLSPLFPYTTLFRSHVEHVPHQGEQPARREQPRRLGRCRLRVEPVPRLGDGDQLGAAGGEPGRGGAARTEEHTSELQSRLDLVCRLLHEKKKQQTTK